MFRSRVLPVLLLRSGQLYKSVRFRSYTYIGDPINAVKILSKFSADEIVILDIDASRQNTVIDLNLVRDIATESEVPLSVGGGISSLFEIEHLLRNGADKVVLNNSVTSNPKFLQDAVHHFGSSTISVCIDLIKGVFGGYRVYNHKLKKTLSIDYSAYLRLIDEYSPGEIIIQSVDLDGTMKGYDINLYKEFSCDLTTPVLALGGVGSIKHIKDLMNETSVNGFCASSIFLYYGTFKGVLINYPRIDINDIQKQRECFKTLPDL